MAIEIVDFPIKHGDFPWQNVSSPEGNPSAKFRLRPSSNLWQLHRSCGPQGTGGLPRLVPTRDEAWPERSCRGATGLKRGPKRFEANMYIYIYVI